MANNQPRAGSIQRPNGATQNKICQFKTVLLGESAVGKSSLVLRFVKGQFPEYPQNTIGAAFLTRTIQIEDTAVKFEIWVNFDDFYVRQIGTNAYIRLILGHGWTREIS